MNPDQMPHRNTVGEDAAYQPPVFETFNDLNDALKHLDERLKELRDRVGPVMTPESPHASEDKNSTPDRSQSMIATRLFDEACKARRMVRDVDDIIGRLEV